MDKTSTYLFGIFLLALCIFLDWLLVYKFKLFSKNTPTEKDEREINTVKRVSSLDFFLSMIMISVGQYIIAAPGKNDIFISYWLVSNFYLAVDNLDNILIGTGLILIGAMILLRKVWSEKITRHLEWHLRLKEDLRWITLKPAFRPLIIGSLLFIILLLSLRFQTYNITLPILWILSVGMIVMWVIRLDLLNRNSIHPGIQSQDIQIVFGILLFAVIVLAYKLRDFPAELIGDEGSFWTLAKDMSMGQDTPPIFAHGIYSFGVLGSYFQAILIKLFGDGLWVWRFSSVITAVASIPAVYFLAREMFDRRVAIVASLSVVSLPYLIAFSRLGYNNIQTVLIASWTVCLFYMGYRRLNYSYLLMSGIIAGFGVYTYHAALGGFFAVGLFYLLIVCTSQKNRTIYIYQLGSFLVGFLLIALPYLVFSMGSGSTALGEKPLESLFFNRWYGDTLFLAVPEYQSAPTMDINGALLFFSPRLWAILIIRGFVRTFLSFQMPYLVSEHFIYSPLVGPASVVFYIIGLLSLFRKKWEARSAFILIWLIVNVTLFSALNTFPPRQTHLVGLIPVFGILIARGIVVVVDQMKDFNFRLKQGVQELLITLLTAVVCITGIYNYFVVVPQHYKPDFEQIYSWYSMYGQNAGITYVHADSEKPDPEPFFLKRITKDVDFSLVSESAYSKLAGVDLVKPDQLYFFTPETFTKVRKNLGDLPAEEISIQQFYDEGGKVAAYGVWLSTTPVYIPRTFAEVFTESYQHPAIWILSIIFCFVILLLWILPRIKKSLPAFVTKGFDWIPQEYPDEADLLLGEDGLSVIKRPVNAWNTLSSYFNRKSNKLMQPEQSGDTEALSPKISLASEENTPVSAPHQEEPMGINDQSSTMVMSEQISEPHNLAEEYRPFISIEFKFQVNLPQKKTKRAAQVKAKGRKPSRQISVDTTKIRRTFSTVLLFFQKLANGLSEINVNTWMTVIGLAVLIGVVGEIGLIFSNKLTPNIWLVIVGAIVVAFACNFQKIKPIFSDDLIAKTSTSLFSTEVQKRMMIIAVVLSVLGIILLKNHNWDLQYWDVLIIWIVSILAVVLAYLPAGLSNPNRQLKIDWKVVLPIFAVVLIGAALRFYQLGDIPLTMENDEGTVGMKAISALTGELKSMFETFGGYGTLHFFLMAIPIQLFGRTIFAIRILTAIYGAVTLPVVYILAKELFSPKVALVSTALLAFSHLHIQFSRVSPTASSLDPLLSSLAFLFLYRGIKNNRTFDWVISALVMGIGMYFYVGARAMLVVSAGFIVYTMIFYWSRFKENLHNFPIYILTFLIVSAPMLYWAYVNPDAFNARVNQVGIIQNGWLQAEMTNRGVGALPILWEQLVNSILIFYYSFPRWFYEADIPALHVLSGFLFACGLLITIVRIKNPRYALLHCWFWITLLSGQVLQVDPAPNAYRTLGLYPAICMFGGIALVWILESWSQSLVGRKKMLPTLAIIGVLALEGYANVQYYFGEWAPRFLYSDKRSRTESLVGAYVGKLPNDTVTYIADSESYWGSGSPSFDYQSNDHPYVDVKGSLLEVIPEVKDKGRALFILPQERYDELYVLERELPGGEVDYQYLGEDVYFMAYRYGLQ